MEFKKPIRRVPCQVEVLEGQEICGYFKCPKCGKEHQNLRLDKKFPRPGDEVTCERCGEKFIPCRNP